MMEKMGKALSKNRGESIKILTGFLLNIDTHARDCLLSILSHGKS
jgi:hypothetical protein